MATRLKYGKPANEHVYLFTSLDVFDDARTELAAWAGGHRAQR
ncbi:hypothetical protein ACFU99_17825 [Streptomyces sp. NPDC057654]